MVVWRGLAVVVVRDVVGMRSMVVVRGEAGVYGGLIWVCGVGCRVGQCAVLGG
jgi:hypothetical protein